MADEQHKLARAALVGAFFGMRRLQMEGANESARQRCATGRNGITGLRTCHAGGWPV